MIKLLDMIEESGKYSYTHGDITVKGNFNINQGKDGSIILLMGNSYTRLFLKQTEELHLDLYSLPDFDIDAFHKFYNIHD